MPHLNMVKNSDMGIGTMSLSDTCHECGADIIGAIVVSLGKELNYYKLGGTRDLAGSTGVLKEIRNMWNEAYENGRLNSVEAHAIGVNFLGTNSDLVVPISSQLGGKGATEFKGLIKHKYDIKSEIELNANTGSVGIKVTTENGFHSDVTKQDYMRKQVKDILSGQPTKW